MSSGAAAGMEDVKTEVAVQGEDRPGAEARFADLCKAGLGLDEGSMKDAMAVFRGRMSVISANTSAVGSGSPEEIERCWSAMTLYSVAKLREGKSDPKNGKGGFNLSRILRAAQFNAADFFREMPQFVIKAGHILSSLYGSDWEKRLEVTETQANFVHLRVLSNHYKRTYQEYFLLSGTTSENYNINSGNPAFVSECHRFGWLLFLDLLVHAFTPVKDLVTCTTGLVSILIILILHVPVSLRKFSVLDSARLAKKSDKGIELLESLSDSYDTSVDDLRAVMDKTNNLIVDILKKKPLPASECHAESLAGINTDGLLYFEGLMDGSSLQSSLLILEKDYDEAIYTKGEFDGRMFVSDEDSLLGTGSLSGGAINICSSKCKFGSVASPAKTITSTLSTPYSPASPANGNIRGCSRLFPTPVTTAMATAKWLRTIISPLPSQPTAELEGFLSSCERDVTSDVVRRAQIILEAIFPSSSLGDESIAETLQNGALMDHTWAEQRKMEALKLYYRVLEAICRAESQLHGNNLTSLLSNERFHRCMLACSAELVLATHKTVTMMFPAVLERTGITAFDLSKVIESFVRHEETLPRELKRHLNSLEERLLESMVWEKGSSIYNSLIIARPALSIEVSRLGLEAAPMPPLEAIAMNRSVFNGVFSPNDIRKREHSPGIYRDQNGDIRSPKRVCTETRNVLVERNSLVSPVKDQLLPFNSLKSKVPLQSAFATPTRRNPARGGETCAETGVNIFFNKISKLAAIRIKSLCEKLQLSHQILEHIYSLIQQILNQRTSLFFNRHIDQIILCSFYGVAKISKLALTFKEIINSYRKQPHCKPQVFRSVFVDWSLTGHNGNRGQGHVDIITFYNEVFIPSVKPFLMELGSSGSTLRNSQNPEDNSTANVQCLGSPRLPFPALPDMSPKKVSTTHNVYVSPLRSSKMDALLSPSSKSYYACVGESTHAYQSPSKDLSIINNRLNYGSKMRLNFDMVSDSLVVGTLGPQNGTMSTLPSSTNLKQAVKCEQPDS